MFMFINCIRRTKLKSKIYNLYYYLHTIKTYFVCLGRPGGIYGYVIIYLNTNCGTYETQQKLDKAIINIHKISGVIILK